MNFSSPFLPQPKLNNKLFSFTPIIRSKTGVSRIGTGALSSGTSALRVGTGVQRVGTGAQRVGTGALMQLHNKFWSHFLINQS